MRALMFLRLALIMVSCLSANVSHGDVVASFDDLPSSVALDSATNLPAANAGSPLYQGVTWDSRFLVVGEQYRTSPAPNPLFGIPHSPHYYVTNQDGVSGLLISTELVLTGAWFGRNQYYGYSEGGADQITIVALSGARELASVVFDLPESHPGQPEPLSFVDTGSFAALAGITGYRIDRREVGEKAGNWVADDFQFGPKSAATTPAAECLFAWAERNHPGLFSPAGSPTLVSPAATYRYYPASNTYLRIASANSHVYYQAADGTSQDVGLLSDWLPKVGCQTQPPSECLFAWAEQNYPALFAPAGTATAVWSSYTYRYYRDTKSYLGVSAADDHVYYQGVDGHFQDEGPLSKWLPLAGCQ